MAAADKFLPTKERILRVCVRLFLEKGYAQTTIADIVKQAGVSNSSFQHFFRAKDGVLTELVRFMYRHQFSIACDAVDKQLSPVRVYAVETAIQITLTELNENLREIYLAAYSHKEALEFIQQTTAKELHRIFGPYQPELSEQDFYALDIGSSGLMRAYMAHPCDEGLTLEKKLESFLVASLRMYNVPEEEVRQVVAFVLELDIRALSQQVMDRLFASLAMRFDFALPE